MKEIVIKLQRIHNFSINKTWFLCAKATIEKENGFLIIDTGAQISIINSQYFYETQFNTIPRDFLSFNLMGFSNHFDELTDFELIRRLTISFSKHSFNFENLILTNLWKIQSQFEEKHKILGILGNNFFYQYKAIINYGTKTLHLFEN